jgi:hypothetical protein
MTTVNTVTMTAITAVSRNENPMTASNTPVASELRRGRTASSRVSAVRSLMVETACRMTHGAHTRAYWPTTSTP